MNETRHPPHASEAMLERARRILELTHHDWRLHEQVQAPRKGKRARRQGTFPYTGGFQSQTSAIIVPMDRR